MIELVLLSLRENSVVILPIAVLLGCVLGLGRLYHDSEIAAAQACGIGNGPLYRAAGLVTLIAAALCGWIALIEQGRTPHSASPRCVSMRCARR